MRWKHCIIASVPLGFSEVTRGKALVTLEVLNPSRNILYWQLQPLNFIKQITRYVHDVASLPPGINVATHHKSQFWRLPGYSKLLAFNFRACLTCFSSVQKVAPRVLYIASGCTKVFVPLVTVKIQPTARAFLQLLKLLRFLWFCALF